MSLSKIGFHPIIRQWFLETFTPPESLNILVSSKQNRLAERSGRGDSGQGPCGGRGKRGVHPISVVDRIVPLSGKFQRIAEFVGGHEMHGDGYEPVYQKRPVTLTQSDMQNRAKS